MTITCTVNAGLSIACGSFKLLVDPFPTERVGVFSSLTGDMLAQALDAPAFQSPDLVFITHTHRDHYNAAVMQRFLTRWPAARIIMPDNPFHQGLLLNASCTLQRNGAQLRFFPLTHQGAEYTGTAHFGLLLTVDGMTLLLVGDGVVAEESLAGILAGETVDIAVLPFPWVSLRRGVAFVDQVVRPKHILVNHLPLPASDIFHYAESASRHSAQISCTSDVQLMNVFLKSVHF